MSIKNAQNNKTNTNKLDCIMIFSIAYWYWECLRGRVLHNWRVLSVLVTSNLHLFTPPVSLWPLIGHTHPHTSLSLANIWPSDLSENWDTFRHHPVFHIGSNIKQFLTNKTTPFTASEIPATFSALFSENKLKNISDQRLENILITIDLIITLTFNLWPLLVQNICLVCLVA